MRQILATAANRPGLMLSFVLVGVVIVYLPGLDAPFYLDDWAYIVTNPSIQIERLDFESLYRAGIEFPHPGRPFVAMTFSLDYYFHGMDASGFRVMNIAIHLLTGILVYAFVILTLRTPALQASVPQPEWLALAVALLWLLHPLQIQSVTYIWQRTNSLAVLFYLLAFIGYVKGRLEIASPKRVLYWSGACLSWLVAMGSKEIAAPLPFFILLYEWFFFQELSRSWFRRAMPWITVTVLLGAAIIFYHLGANPLGWLAKRYTDRDFDLVQRVLTEWRIVAFYLGLLAFPHPGRLSLDHDFTISQSLFTPATTLGAGLLLLTMLLAAVGCARRWRLFSFAILWFLGHLVIESTIIPLELIFEHRLYLPSVGLILACVWLLWQLRLRPLINALVILGIGLLYCVWTYERNELWAHEIEFWQEAVVKAPRYPRPYTNLAMALTKVGKMGKAEDAYTQAIRIFEQDTDHPIRDGKSAVHAYLRRAEIRLGLGDRAGAQEDLRTLVRLNPRSDAKPVLTIMIGNLLVRAGLKELAAEQYSWVIETFESRANAPLTWQNQAAVAYNNRGAIRFRQGDLEGAMKDAERALHLDARLEGAHVLKKAVLGLLNKQE